MSNMSGSENVYLIKAKDYDAGKKIVRSSKGGNFMPKYPFNTKPTRILSAPAITILVFMMIPISFILGLNLIKALSLALIVFTILIFLRSISGGRNKYIIEKGSAYYQVRGLYVGKFTLKDYNTIKKYSPDELDDWIEAIVDAGENKIESAQKYAQRILNKAKRKEYEEDKKSYQRSLQEITNKKDREEKEKAWEHKIINDRKQVKEQ